MYSFKQRVLATGVAILTMFTSVPTQTVFADVSEPQTTVESSKEAGNDVSSSSVESTSAETSVAEPTTEQGTIAINTSTFGGTIEFTTNDDQATKQTLKASKDDSKYYLTDTKGNTTEVAKDENGYVYILTEDVGTVVNTTVKSDDTYDIATYSVTTDGGGKEDTALPEKATEYSYDITVEKGQKVLNVEFDQSAEDEKTTKEDSESTSASSSEEKLFQSIAKDSKVTKDDLDKIDFSTARLILGTSDENLIIDKEDIISSYDGVYLLQYADATTAKNAYSYYYGKVDFVESDAATVNVADIEDVANDKMTTDSNPIAELADSDKSNVSGNVIALIDTGASENANVVERVSMLGDDPSDDNGHGDKMIETILGENPNAKIISIKALDSTGKGTPSSVYAAIEYAIEKNVNIINLSLSATKSDERSVIIDAIKEAVSKGITVIGAAGNNNSNAKYFIPGCIDDVIVAGAVDKDDKLTEDSNKGDTVDYYVVAKSTSYAAAKLTGIFSKEGKIKADNKTVFTTAKGKVSDSSSGDNDPETADGGSGSAGTGGGGSGVANQQSGFCVWNDQGPNTSVNVNNNSELQKEADRFRTQFIEKHAMPGTMSTISQGGVKTYLSLYNQAAKEALQDAAARSNTGKARIVGAIGVYVYGNDGITAFPLDYTSEDLWKNLTHWREGNRSELPDKYAWDTLYNNSDIKTGNWRAWLYNYGLQKVRNGAGFLNTTVIVYAVASDEPKQTYVHVKKSLVDYGGNAITPNRTYNKSATFSIYLESDCTYDNNNKCWVAKSGAKPQETITTNASTGIGDGTKIYQVGTKLVAIETVASANTRKIPSKSSDSLTVSSDPNNNWFGNRGELVNTTNNTYPTINKTVILNDGSVLPSTVRSSLDLRGAVFGIYNSESSARSAASSNFDSIINSITSNSDNYDATTEEFKTSAIRQLRDTLRNSSSGLQEIVITNNSGVGKSAFNSSNPLVVESDGVQVAPTNGVLELGKNYYITELKAPDSGIADRNQNVYGMIERNGVYYPNTNYNSSGDYTPNSTGEGASIPDTIKLVRVRVRKTPTTSKFATAPLGNRHTGDEIVKLGNGWYNLAGIHFQVMGVTGADKDVKVIGAADGTTSDGTPETAGTRQASDLITDETGYTPWSELACIHGETYRVIETQTNEYFKLDPVTKDIVATVFDGTTVNIDNNPNNEFSVEDTPETTELRIRKTSDNPAVTDGNNCYSLDAVYGVYEEKDPNTLLGKVTINGKTGVSSAISGYTNFHLAIGHTYWVKENPDGYRVKPEDDATGYYNDNYWHSITVVKDQSQNIVDVTKTSDVNSKTVLETPAMDPLAFIKSDVYGSKYKEYIGQAEGAATYEGAWYQLDYYDNYDCSGTPKASWVFATDKTGAWMYDPSYLAKKNGVDVLNTMNGLYTNNNNTPNDTSDDISMLPLGSIKIHEVLNPKGYLKDETTYYATINFNVKSQIPNLVWDNKLIYSKDNNVVNPAEMPKYGGITVRKSDYIRTDAEGKTTPMGDATFKGAEYTIYYIGGDGQNDGVVVDGNSYSLKNKVKIPTTGKDLEGVAVKTITTDETGVATTGGNCLPLGTYVVVETKAPTGYLLNDTTKHWYRIFDIKDFAPHTDDRNNEIQHEFTAAHQNAYDVDYNENGATNPAITGNVVVVKYDADTGTAKETDSLAGTKIDIINKSAQSVVTYTNGYNEDGIPVDGKGRKVTAVGDVVTTIETHWDANYVNPKTGKTGAFIATLPNNYYLPYGTYTLKESGRSKGYLINDSTQTFTIRENGVVVDKTTDNNQISFSNHQLRKNIEFKKFFEKYMDAMEVPFLVYNKETGEAHILSTDPNGIYRSGNDYVKMTAENINKNDGTNGSNISKYFDKVENADGTVIYNLKEEYDPAKHPRDYKRANSKDFTYMNPVFFEYSYKGADPAVDYTRQAYPIGKYEIVELPVETHSTYMIRHSFEINDHFSAYANLKDNDTYDVMQDLGSFDDSPNPTGYSVALDSETKDHISKGDEDVTWVEKVHFDNLEPGKEYTAYSTIRDKQNRNVFFADVDEKDGVKFVSGLVQWVQPKDSTSYDVNITLHFKGDSLKPYKNIKEVMDALKNGTTNGVNEDWETYLNKTGVVFTELYYSDDYNRFIDEGKEDEILDGTDHLLGLTNIRDEEETVHIPVIFTDAKDADTLDEVGSVKDNSKFVDTIEYHNLIPGTYQIQGQLIDISDGNKVVATSVDKTSFEVTPENSTFNKYTTGYDGSTDVTYTFDSRPYAGHVLVATEKVLLNGAEVATHENTEDQRESIYYPEVVTKEASLDTADEVGAVENGTGIEDTVKYSNFVVGESYIIHGQLIDKDTGKAIKGEDGKDITAEQRVDAKTAIRTINGYGIEDGEAKLDYYFSSKDLANHTVVAYTWVTHDVEGTDQKDWVEVRGDRRLENFDESVFYPEFSTVAIDGDTEDHVGTVEKKVSVLEQIHYENLVVGKEYTFTSTLMDRDKKVPLGLEGTKQELTFKPENGKNVVLRKEDGKVVASGDISTTFNFDSSTLEGVTAVAFTELHHKNALNEDDVVVRLHDDYNDELESIHYPKIRTKAVDDETRDDVGKVEKEAHITDTVEYWNLIPGMKYSVTGKVMNQQTQQPVVQNNAEITDESGVFVADKVDGSLDMHYTLDSTLLKDNTVVVFEKLWHPNKNEESNKNINVTSHEDITDKGQSVHYPDIHTSARDSRTGDHVGSIFGELINKVRAMLGDEDVTNDGIKDSVEQTIIDTVTLNNLVPGRTYTVTGKLMNVETGNVILIDGEEVKQTAVITVGEDGTLSSNNGEKTTVTKYVAQKSNPVNAGEKFNYVNGTVDLTYKLDSSKLVNYNKNSEKGIGAVVFEDLIHNDVVVNYHHEIKDEGQTVGDVGIHTEAVDSKTGDHVGDTPRNPETWKSIEDDTDTTINDTVAMTKLVKGMTYTVKGALVDQSQSTVDKPMYLKADGSVTPNRNEAITQEVTFVADDKMEGYKALSNNLMNGNVHVIFTVASSLVEGKTIVVFEDLYHNNVKISTHSNINDEKQAVHYPKVRTTAGDAETSTYKVVDENGKTIKVVDMYDHSAKIDKESVVVDTVKFTNLLKGKEYTVTGTLHYQEDFGEHKEGDVVLDAKGNPYTKKATITVNADGTVTAPDGERVRFSGGATEHSVDGSVDLVFTVDNTALTGSTVVAFEELEHNNIKVAAHADINDDEQSWHNPDIHTSAVDGKTLDDVGTSEENATVVDTVKLTNLHPGYIYVISGQLMDKKTGKALIDKDGVNGKEIYQSTTITVSEDGTKITAQNGEKTTVTYNDTVKKRVDGTVDLTFHFDSSDLDGYSTVAFEKLYHDASFNVKAPKTEVDKPYTPSEDAVEIYKHEDINDAGQEVHYPKIQTKARDGLTDDEVGVVSHIYDKDGNIIKETVKDVVTYENLVVGKTYTFTGKLMDKRTGKALLDKNGKEVTASVSVKDGNVVAGSSVNNGTAVSDFVVTKTTPNVGNNGITRTYNGSVELLFTYDTSNQEAESTVVYEKLFHNVKDSKDGKPVEVTQHEDIKDNGQMIHYPKMNTTATDLDTKDHVGTVSTHAGETEGAINDKISYENLVVGKTYTVRGVLIIKDSKDAIDKLNARNNIEGRGEVKYVEYTDDNTGKKYLALADADGKLVTAETTFVAGKTESPVTNLINELGKDVVVKDFANRETTIKSGAPLTVNGDDVNVKFNIDTSVLSSVTLVVFEKMYHPNVNTGKDVEVYAHSNIDDEDQTVHYPDVHTSAMDSRTGDHVGSIFGALINSIRKALGENVVPEDKQQIIDTVSLDNLRYGMDYTVKGKLYNAKGEAIVIDGKEVTNEVTVHVDENGVVTAGKDAYGVNVKAYQQGETVNGKEITKATVSNSTNAAVDLYFTLDSSALINYDKDSEEGKTVVVFEKLIHNDVEVNRHEKPDDKGQTVGDVGIHTEAVDSKTGDHVGDTPRKPETYKTVEDDVATQIIDTVNMTKLVKGMTYTITGQLVVQNESTKDVPVYLKKDGTTTKNRNDKNIITVSKTFVADANGVKDYKEIENDLVNGTVTLTYDVSSSLVAGKTIVVFEDLYHNNVKISTHADITDEKQAVHYPNIYTKAIDGNTKDDVGDVHETATIVDTVSLNNLITGMDYTVHGVLHDQKTGEIFKHANGEPVEQTAEIHVASDGRSIIAKGGEKTTVDTTTSTSTYVNGTVNLTFSFDSSLLGGKTLVTFEDLNHNGIKVDSHSNIFDKAQTTHYPDIHTTAVDKKTNDHVGTIFGELINSIRRILGEEVEDGKLTTIIDTVTLDNLVPGRTYTVKGILMNSDSGEAIKIDDNTITREVTFTVADDGSTISFNSGNVKEDEAVVTNYDATYNQVDGYIKIEFTYDNSKLIKHGSDDESGVSTVVFEDLYHNDVKVNFHNDLKDNGQTVENVGIHTTAVDTMTNDHVGTVPSGDQKSVSIKDAVNMTKLRVGEEYTIKGALVDQDAFDATKNTTKAFYLGTDGNLTNDRTKAVTAELTFTAKSETESHDLVYTISSRLVQGRSITVFEDLYHKNVKVSTHSDAHDKNQTVYYPTGKTNVSDNVSGLHEGEAREDFTVTDSVYFQNLIVGEEYTVNGNLRYQENFEDHKAGDFLTDEWAKNSTTFVASEGMNNLVDASGNAVTVKDVKVTERKDGTKSVSGYIDLVFNVDASALEGATIVAAETFKHKGVTIFAHNTLDDVLKDTPETVKIPKIRTTAKTEDLDENAVYNEDGSFKVVPIVDTVNYKNLWTAEEVEKLHEEGLVILENGNAIPTALAEGRPDVFNVNESPVYVVQGTLMDKETGEPIVNDKGEKYVSYAVIDKDHAEDGQIDVKFEINPADFVKGAEKDGYTTLEGKSVVVFEKLFHVPYGSEFEDVVEHPEKYTTGENEKMETAKHEDIKDVEQDIRFPKGRTHANDNNDSKVDEHTVEEFSGNHEALANSTENKNIVSVNGKEITVIDNVSYENLHGGTKYDITATLQVITGYNEDGTVASYEVAKDDKGNEITTTAEFTTTGEYDDNISGYVPVTFKFNGLNLAGKTTVAFETFSREGQNVMVHANINDAPQTVHIPEIHTNSWGINTPEDFHEGFADENATVFDKITYTNLKPGHEYTATGKLVVKEDSVDGKVAYLKTDGTTTTDPEDKDIVTASRKFIAGEPDKVYKQILKDQYELENGDSKAAIGEFETPIETPEETPQDEGWVGVSGTVTLVFSGFDLTPLAGKTVVAFEKVLNDKKLVAIHEDITDEGQTVSVPKVETKALDKNTETHTSEYSGKTTIIDTVKLTNLKINDINGESTTYKLEGTLMNKKTGKPIEVNGKEVKAYKEFTAADAQKEHKDAYTVSENGLYYDGIVDLEFTFDSTALEGETVVAFEKLYRDDIPVGSHEDINDEAQSVSIISIHTNATNGTKGENNKELDLGDKVKLVDTVTYKGLIKGKKYTLHGTVMDKATGKPLVIDGKQVVASTEFVAGETSSNLKPVETVEGAKLDKTLVVGKDIPEGNYKITATPDENGVVNGKWVVYSNEQFSVPEGNYDVYTLRGIINGITSKVEYVKLTKGEVITFEKDVDVAPITEEVKGIEIKEIEDTTLPVVESTTAKTTENTKAETTEKGLETVNGTVDVVFTLNTNKVAGKELVVFEELHTENENGKDVTVATHKDLNDKSQTVKVKTPEKTTFSQTGEQRGIMIGGVALISIALAMIITALLKRKKYSK